MSVKSNSTFSLILLMYLFCCIASCQPSETEDRHLSNAFMSLKFFTPEQGGGVRSIKNTDGFEFINRHQDKSLWRIELKRIPKTDAKKEINKVEVGDVI